MSRSNDAAQVVPLTLLVLGIGALTGAAITWWFARRPKPALGAYVDDERRPDVLDASDVVRHRMGRNRRDASPAASAGPRRREAFRELTDEDLEDMGPLVEA